MTFQLEVELHIPDQIFETVEYFNTRRFRLGEEVEKEIYSLLDRITAKPFQFPKVRGEI
jgi:predicted solute-binding protein